MAPCTDSDGRRVVQVGARRAAMLHNDPRIEAPTATPRTITRSGLQDEHRPRHHTAATHGRRHELRLLLRRAAAAFDAGPAAYTSLSRSNRSRLPSPAGSWSSLKLRPATTSISSRLRTMFDGADKPTRAVEDYVKAIYS